jgi:hypothetical protein
MEKVSVKVRIQIRIKMKGSDAGSAILKLSRFFTDNTRILYDLDTITGGIH